MTHPASLINTMFTLFSSRIGSWHWLLAICLVSGPNLALEQSQLDRLAEELKIGYRVVDNLDAQGCDTEITHGLCFEGELTIGFQDIAPAKGWELYFHHIAPIQKSKHAQVSIEHINGDLHRVRIAPDLIKPGSQIKVPFLASFWHTSYTDLIPNYFVSGESLKPRVVDSTRTRQDPVTGLDILPFVEPLTLPRQTRRGKGDQLPKADSQWLYDYYTGINPLAEDVQVQGPSTRVIPQVSDARWSGERIVLPAGLNIAAGERSAHQAAVSVLEGRAIPLTGKGLPLSISIHQEEALASEGYRLKITANEVAIKAATKTGADYGLLTLAQLYDEKTHSLPIGQVKDAPHYGYRGMHLDVSRNFHGKQAILELIEQMFTYKLNTLHLHLADDEGWRLEIPGLPELTEKGAYRCIDSESDNCLLPQLGSGVERNARNNGYLSVEDYQQVVRYAAQRHINVVPSLDMPGHSRAAVKAMETRYQRFAREGDVAKASEFLLSDFEDSTQYQSIQFYSDNTLNPCMDSTYHFVDTVLDALVEMHKAAGAPLTRYHMGADETAGAWVESPICKQFIDKQLRIESSEQLLAYFIARMIELGHSKGLTVGAWSDGLSKLSPIPGSNKVQSNVWETLSWQGHEMVENMQAAGVETVLSSPDALYFDFPYRNHPSEPGYYWASKNTDSFKVFQLMPDNPAAMAELWTNRMGLPYSTHTGEQDVPPLAGIQGQFWSEVTRSTDALEYMIYPRLLVLAERAWHAAEWALPRQPGRQYSQQTHWFDEQRQQAQTKDWQRYAYALASREMLSLAKAGLNFRLPPPGIQVATNTVALSSPFAGLQLQYRTPQGEWRDYHAPVAKGQISAARVKLAGSSRTSAITELQP